MGQFGGQSLAPGMNQTHALARCLRTVTCSIATMMDRPIQAMPRV